MNIPFMKKTLLIGLIGLFCSSLASAKKLEGYFINQENDTIEVLFSIPTKFLSGQAHFESIQWRVKYYNSSNEKQILKPSQAKEFGFVFKGEQVRFLSRKNSLSLSGPFFGDTEYVFLKLEVEGKLKLFHFYSTQSSPGIYNASSGMMTGGYFYSLERYILQKDDGELFKPRGIAFRKDMAKYLFDCPTVADRIEGRDLKKGDIEQIVVEYNRCRNKSDRRIQKEDSHF
jgi:hypothetical protein